MNKVFLKKEAMTVFKNKVCFILSLFYIDYEVYSLLYTSYAIPYNVLAICPNSFSF